MAVGDRVDPYRGFNFRVEIGNGGAEVAAFREVSGMNFTIDPVEYRVGNSPDLHPIKQSGMRKFQNLSLRRGITDRAHAVAVVRERRPAGSRTGGTARWFCSTRSRTTSCAGSSRQAGYASGRARRFNAMQSEIAIEAIEICLEKFELV